MTSTQDLRRTRTELSEFLRRCRERRSPEDAGLPAGGRRRTPGLRREEVAALAGVGVTWYTWLEQGRDIGVSATFLDNLARVFRLDATERRHLYLLAHQRPPTEQARTWCTLPALVHRLLADLAPRPAYVLNLRWDVLAWNPAADRLFGFSAHPPEQRNLLWLLFMDPRTRTLFHDWETQAPHMLSSFRRDFTRAPDDSAIKALVADLRHAVPEFRSWWHRHDMSAPCRGVRAFSLDGLGTVELEHMTLTVDEDRHLRLVYYAPVEEQAQAFERWLEG
ncbi:helix-turn-helix transcriptional regulator [Aquisalimonas asiatica]|nr:helix-turn-helix transcriptional regulator [Aquisalimonas asiatica]